MNSLCGSKCKLVPYTKDCVKTYHSWFVKYPELLEATGSEFLTLAEEYENQKSWENDESKLTFLIMCLDPNKYLCGDINAFFSLDEDDPTLTVAELNLMVAEPSAQRRGIATEALDLFMQYIGEILFLNKKKIVFIAKIQITNHASINLFEKMGFTRFKTVLCFNEAHYRFVGKWGI